MANLSARPKLDLIVNFEINEVEARALDALVGYGDDAFIKVFYEKLGKAYMDKHEQGLRAFFKSIRLQMPLILSHMDDARKAFKIDG